MVKPEPKLVQEQQTEPLFKAPTIAKEITVVEATITNTEREYGEAAFSGDDAAISSIEDKLSAERLKLTRLKAKYTTALEADEKERRRILAEHNKTIIRVCRSHLAARDTAAERLSVALAEVIAQYKIMVERGGKAKAAVPDWGLSRGNLVDSDELYRLVQKEISRLYGAPPSINGYCPFPGGETHDLHNRLQPQLLPPLADTLRTATAGIIENLTGKVIE